MAFYISLISTILWFIFMTYLSHQDGEHTGKTSRELAEHLRFLDNDTVKLFQFSRRLFCDFSQNGNRNPVIDCVLHFYNLCRLRNVDIPIISCVVSNVNRGRGNGRKNPCA